MKLFVRLWQALAIPVGNEEKGLLVSGIARKKAGAGGEPSVKHFWKKSLQVLLLPMDVYFLDQAQAKDDCQYTTELHCCLKSEWKRCFNAVVGSRWFATEDNKSPIKFNLNSPISLVPLVTRFNCAGVSYAVWYHSFRGSLSLEVTLVCPVDAIIFVSQTMFYCEDMGQMAQSLAVQSKTVSSLFGNKQNQLSLAHETLVPITV